MSRILTAYGTPCLIFAAAALLEVFGDSCFQTALRRSSGAGRVSWIIFGTFILALYGFTVNISGTDFGRLLGVYVVFFFFAAQIVAKLRFNEPMTLPIRVGGVLIAAGGLIVSFWKQ